MSPTIKGSSPDGTNRGGRSFGEVVAALGVSGISTSGQMTITLARGTVQFEEKLENVR